MAVTHADLAPTPKPTLLRTKTAAFLMVLCILLGLFCFILCLVAESARSQCAYTGGGKLPLLSATAAFLALAMAMVVQHTYLLLAVSDSDALMEMSWDLDSVFAKNLTRQAGSFFVATWMSFAVGEILLLIGLSIESGHLKNWAAPRPSCLTIRQGLFTAAGVLGLVTVFLAFGLYITALRAERYFEEREIRRREMWEASVMYASPPRSPERTTIRAAPSESPLARQDQSVLTLYHYLRAFDKHSTLV
ncbi:uncharacterized protein LOC105157054 [Sesamum indicum]|uniref:Uncharacterized protein LOC105157054 n=1 Tax=Sesamum indicum TaxID=4182 RepID=A0A6I9SNK4_SESIN|nr:uncharacterized protein LOC105157054 [Sesamum indicum]